jgi:hypothetical protein
MVRKHQPQENLNFGFVRIVTRGCAFVVTFDVSQKTKGVGAVDANGWHIKAEQVSLTP